MPNWCMNTVTFKHSDPKEVVRLQEAFQREELFFEFAPNPNGKQAEDWYSHNINEWGTKWDVGGDEDMIRERTDNTINLSFDTAWSPPVRFYEVMEEFGWEIEAYYYEPGMAFCGKYTSSYGDEFYDIPETSDEAQENIPSDIDEMFCISETIANYEEEQESEEDE